MHVGSFSLQSSFYLYFYFSASFYFYFSFSRYFLPSSKARILSASLLFCSAKVIALSSSDMLDSQAGKSISSSYFVAQLTTCWCICLMMTAALFPDISHGRTQCFTPLAAYEFSYILQIHPRGRGIMNAPLQNPQNWLPNESLPSETNLIVQIGCLNLTASSKCCARPSVPS